MYISDRHAKYLSGSMTYFHSVVIQIKWKRCSAFQCYVSIFKCKYIVAKVVGWNIILANKSFYVCVPACMYSHVLQR